MGLFDRKTGRGSNTAKGKQGFQKATPKPAAAPTSYTNSPVKLPPGATPPGIIDNRPSIDDMASRFRSAHPEYNTPLVAVPVPTAYGLPDDFEELTYRCSRCGGDKNASEMASMSLCRSCAGV